MRILARDARVIRHKLLLDKNLSPAAGIALRAAGVDVVHVRERGLLGATDAAVLDCAFQEDRIVVTANVDDFVKLARAREIHSGIVLIQESGLTREEQLTVMRRALDLREEEYSYRRDLINRVLHFWADRHVFEDAPPG